MIELIPAIDIIDGKCVRLTKGDYAQKKVYNEDPVSVAMEFERLGFKRLHVVDLDGAKSKHIVNVDVLKKISESTQLTIDFGGGIKSDDDIRQLRQLGLEFKRIMNEAPADIEKMYQASKRFNEYLSEISQNRMLYQLDSIIRKIASFTRHKAIEVSVERNQLNALPDNYLKEVDILEARDKSAIAAFMDERLKLWQDLLL